MSKRIIHPKKEKRKKERGKRKEIRSNWSIWALRGWRFKPHIDYLKSARGPDPWEGGKETCLRSRENHVIQYHGWMLLCKSSQRIPANVESNMLDWSLGFTVKAKCIAACTCKWTECQRVSKSDGTVKNYSFCLLIILGSFPLPAHRTVEPSQ